MFHTKYETIQEGSFGDTFSKHVSKLEQMVNDCRDIKDDGKRIVYIKKYVIPEFRKSVYATETSIATISTVVSFFLAMIGLPFPAAIAGGYNMYVRNKRIKEGMRILDNEIDYLDKEIYRLKSTKGKRETIERLEYAKDRLEASREELNIPWIIS